METTETPKCSWKEVDEMKTYRSGSQLLAVSLFTQLTINCLSGRVIEKKQTDLVNKGFFDCSNDGFVNSL